MNKQLKYSLLVVLAFAMIISFANALNIGASPQARPYESNPQNWARSIVNANFNPSTPTAMYDGDLMSSGSIKTFLTTVSTPVNAWFELNTFKNTPSDPLFTSIGWVDFKMKYTIPAFTDDKVRIEYAVGASAWTIISPEVTGAATKFNRDGAAVVRPWTNLVEPNNGVWEWADIAAFKARFYFTKMGTYWDAKTIYINEAWLTVYETAPPTAPPEVGGPAVSIVPDSVLSLAPGSEFFVDIYLRDVVKLWGFQFYIYYDTTVLTATEYFPYHIFDAIAPSWIDDTIGEVEVAYTSYGGDLIGFTGDTPLARIMFIVDGGGATTLHIDTTKPGTGLTEAGTGNILQYTAYDGWFSANIIMSSQPPTVLPPGPPTLGSTWHELYPHYSNMWTLTSWTDQGTLELDASDQIDMIGPDGWRYWFHVDQVTITIHWTFKLPDEGTGEAEPEVPMTELTMGDPTGTRWHQIYPVYSRWFTITSWTDNGDTIFSPTDQFDFQYDDEYVEPPEEWPTHWGHLDAVSTDIILSQKGPGEPAAPEFPMGIGLVMALAPLALIAQVWRTRKKVMKK